MNHMHALKRYLMLGQGDLIQHLMDMVGPELSKPAGEVYRHTLLSMLDGALRSSNAQYDDESSYYTPYTPFIHPL